MLTTGMRDIITDSIMKTLQVRLVIQFYKIKNLICNDLAENLLIDMVFLTSPSFDFGFQFQVYDSGNSN